MQLTKEQHEAGLNEAVRWLGLPHIHHRAVEGVGIDCVHYAHRIFSAIGKAKPDFKIPQYDRKVGIYDASNLIVETLKTMPDAEGKPVRFEYVDFKNGEKPSDFDLLVFKTGGQSGHVAVLIGGLVYHSLAGKSGGVCKSDYRLWKSDIEHIIRLI